MPWRVHLNSEPAARSTRSQASTPPNRFYSSEVYPSLGPGFTSQHSMSRDKSLRENKPSNTNINGTKTTHELTIISVRRSKLSSPTSNNAEKHHHQSDCTSPSIPKLFTSLKIRGVEFHNRIFVSIFKSILNFTSGGKESHDVSRYPLCANTLRKKGV